jgi:hypothetical protein
MGLLLRMKREADEIIPLLKASSYERLGFRVTHEDDRKFYMKRDPDGAGLMSQ